MPKLCDIVQTGEAEWTTELVPHITYGAIGGSAQSFLGSGPQVLNARQRLDRALARRPCGVVIVSTTRPQHLSELVDA